jgi:energy-coupling factor transport system substrate-specific component
MSWQLTSFLILGAVLLAGFAWYERSRPPSQVVALVAALAALAIAGRIAFAAFPNVKPTTDIVIFAGYALGPAPGFAVGALAGLVSNFWFGQGPWTPWQMAGWGLCGILGAALALGTRNAGRFTLAAVCGFAGIAYGILLNFSLMATYGGDLSWQRFLTLEARAVPFDAAHAIGNVTLALIAGPAMVRMLVRFRGRFQWGRGEGPERLSGPAGPRPSLRAGGVAAILLLALALAGALPTRADASGAGRAADWLESVQSSDGGFGASPGDGSGAAMTGWAMLGLEAAGRNPLDVSRRGHSPVDFLRANESEISSTGDLARTTLALEGAGVNPRSFAGRDLVGELIARRRKDGSFEDWPNDTAYSVIALREAGATGGLDKSLEWLRSVQNDDGGWGDTPGSPSTADGTGAVLQALSRGSKAADSGLSHLRKAQRPGGGFPLGGSGAVNSQSTAWAIQGILAAGGDPSSYRRGSSSAPDYLAAQQESDDHYRYSASSDQTPVWVTGEALVAAAGEYLPVPVPPRTPKPSSQAPSSQPEPATGSPPSTSVQPGPSSPPSVPVSPTGSGRGGAGSIPSERLPPTGQSIPRAPAGSAPAGGRAGEGPSASSPPTTATAQPVQGGGNGPSPWAPLGVGLATGGLALGSVLWLGRRFSW